MMATGKTVNSMESVYIHQQQVKPKKENGVKERESTGLTDIMPTDQLIMS